MLIKLLLFALVAEAGAYLTLGLSHQKINVKRLEALLHVCAIDTAAMADINAVVLQDMYDQLRGL